MTFWTLRACKPTHSLWSKSFGQGPEGRGDRFRRGVGCTISVASERLRWKKGKARRSSKVSFGPVYIYSTGIRRRETGVGGHKNSPLARRLGSGGFAIGFPQRASEVDTLRASVVLIHHKIGLGLGSREDRLLPAAQLWLLAMMAFVRVFAAFCFSSPGFLSCFSSLRGLLCTARCASPSPSTFLHVSILSS